LLWQDSSFFFFGKTVLHQSAQFGFLDESAGNALGQVLIGLVLGGQLIKLRGQEWWWWLEGRVYHMDENSWIGLLAWFFTQARL